MEQTPLEKDNGFLENTISSLTDQIDLFETFQSLSLKIISQFDLESIFTTFAGIVEEIMPYQSARIFLLDHTAPPDGPAWQSDTTPPGGHDTDLDPKIIDWVMEQGRWTVITDLLEEQLETIVSILPLKSPKQTLGFMILYTPFTPSAYNRKIGSLLDFVASQAAIAIENQDLYARINHSNRYMTDMLESISNGIMAVDLNGHITRINKNATAILGIKGSRMIGRHFNTVVKGRMKEHLIEIFSAALVGRPMAEAMVNHAPFKEVKLLVGITASLLSDKAKKIIGVIFSFRDMTASKEIERLTRLDQMKSEFVSNVSHELRTPLSIIKSYTEALISQVSPDDHETRETFLSVINNETDRLSGIVGNLLDLSRIESGKFSLDIQNVNMAQLVNTVAGIFRPKLDNIRIFTEFQEGLPDIKADKEKIKEVLINLFSNSVKFSPQGGTIHVTVEIQKGFLICSVADTGIGIPKDKMHKIFDKFYRVDNSDTYEIEGTGLGLSIVKHIIDRHRGKIEASSVLGKGSIFTFCLPLKTGAKA